MDFAALLSDPNVLQGLGNAGQAISQGKSFGEALNPASLIAQIQGQKANQQLLKMLMGGVEETPLPDASSFNKFEAPSWESTLMGLSPTPRGQMGPDSIIRNQTADGETVTIKSPSSKNLSTFGTNVPMESVARSTGGAGGGSATSPFFQALLG